MFLLETLFRSNLGVWKYASAQPIAELLLCTFSTGYLPVTPSSCVVNTTRRSTHLGVGFLLRCFKQLSTLHRATQRLPLARELAHHWCILPNPLVQWKAPRNAPTPTPDMDRTVSRRSEPSSRTALMGEQPNPWDVLPPQVAMSRHRGAKPPRRCGLLGEISLLSLE